MKEKDQSLPLMLASWLIGLLWGFLFGLGDSWLSLMAYLYAVNILLVAFIMVTYFKYKKRWEW